MLGRIPSSAVLKRISYISILTVAFISGLIASPLADRAEAQTTAEVKCTEIIACVNTLLNVIKGLETRVSVLQAILDDAVIDYDVNKCPDASTPFELGFGKMIIGAGAGKMTIGNNIVPLKTRAFEKEDGSETATLKIENMPAHNHNMRGVFDGAPLPANTVGQFIPGGYQTNNQTTYGAPTSMWKQGSGAAFSIMPPPSP